MTQSLLLGGGFAVAMVAGAALALVPADMPHMPVATAAVVAALCALAYVACLGLAMGGGFEHARANPRHPCAAPRRRPE